MPRCFRLAALVIGLLVANAAAAAPRTVEVGVYLVDITAIDELAETYSAEFDVIARWRDPVRAFTPVEGEELPRLLVGPEAATYLDTGWEPEIFAINAVNAGDGGRARVLIDPDGTVTYRVNVRRTLRAQLDFRAFPFDGQVLPVHVESLLYDSDELHLENEADFTGFDASFEMPEWTVTDLTTESRIRERVQENRSYERLSFLVHINRLEGYYVWKIMLPMVVIVMLSWIVFWMSDEMLGRRAGVSSTGMLTIIAYQFVVADSLPRFSYQTVMDRFVLASLLTIAATMVINLIGSRMDVEKRQRLDRACRAIFAVTYTAAVVFVLTGSGIGS